MARRLPKDPGLARRASVRPPKLKLVVVCEGKKTEPAYLRSFAQHHSNGLVELVIIPKGGVPRTIVERAAEERAALIRASKRNKDSFEEYFAVWGVFDVDDHPKRDEAKNMARDNGINLAISDPCAELWAILHYRDYDAPATRKDVQRALAKLMPKYSHRRAPIFDYEAIKDNYAHARDRAILQRRNRRAEQNPDGNPSTNLYELLDVVIANGKA